MVTLIARITNPDLQAQVAELETKGFTKTEIVRFGVMRLYESEIIKASRQPATV